MRLFPEESLVFVRIANARDFGEHVQQTGIGRMLQDPQLKPFLDNLYGKAGDLYAQKAQSTLGISWEDMKKLPKGEVAFAVVARPDKRPALLLMIDQGEDPSVADKLLDRALDLAQEHGAEFTKEKIGDVDVTVVRAANRANRMFGEFKRENTIVIATDPNVLRNVLWHWDHAGEPAGEPVAASATPTEKTAPADVKKDTAKDASSTDKSKTEEAEFVPGRSLAQNERFATILQQCRRKQDPPPQLIYFVDPIELVRNVGRGNGGLQFALGLFPSLGIDGLLGFGGAITYATDEYESLAQFHLLLENPRSGVLQLPAFEAGDTAPQPFVPLSIESYVTWNANLRTMYDRITGLVDQYRYKGSVDKFVQEKISDKLGIDALSQLVDNLKGRFTWTTGFDRPVHMGQQHVVAAELKDEKAAQDALKTVISKHPDLFEEQHFGNVTYYEIKTPEPKNKNDDPNVERPEFHPFVGIMDGYLFIGTSKQRFEQCVAAPTARSIAWSIRPISPGPAP